MKFWRKIRSFLREAAGERDYARYCAHLRARHPGRPMPSEKEFFISRLEEKYSRPSRCC